MLLALARQHRVQYVVAWQLRRHGIDLARWFGSLAEDLDREVRAQALVDAVRHEELPRILAALADVDGAAPVLFKGAALAQTHYREPWLRPRLDTDILIAPASAAEAFEILRSLGYERCTSTSGALVSAQAPFDRVDRLGVAHHLDVHWKIANWHIIANVLSHEEIADRAVPIRALGTAARGPSDIDALIVACLHRAAHHRDSEELLWIYDIHLLAEGLRESDWTAVLAIAERGAVTAICARGLALAIDRFATSVPASVIRRLTEGQRRAGAEPSAVYLSKSFRLVDGLVSDLRSLNIRGGARLIAEHVFPPADYMAKRYGARTRSSMLLAYARRVVAGLPKWLATGREP